MIANQKILIINKANLFDFRHKSLMSFLRDDLGKKINGQVTLRFSFNTKLSHLIKIATIMKKQLSMVGIFSCRN
jgi:hypothetical protein